MKKNHFLLSLTSFLIMLCLGGPMGAKAEEEAPVKLKKRYFTVVTDLARRVKDIFFRPKKTIKKIIKDPTLLVVTPVGIALETVTNIARAVPGSDYLIRDKKIPKASQIKHVMGEVPALEALPNSFSITIWNIFKGDKLGWQDSLETYASQSDLLLLQEAELDPEQVEFYRGRSDYQWIMAQSWFRDSDDGPVATGAMTGSKYKTIFARALHSPQMENSLKTPKTAVVTKYDFIEGEGKLLVINIHALNFISPSGFERNILQLTKFIEGHKGPVIFGGDFNTWSSAKLSGLRDLLDPLGLRAVTFSNDKRTRLKFKPFTPAFDQCFTRGLKVVSSQVIVDKTSDHNPLIISFEREGP